MKIAYLDRDGTINVDYGYIGCVDDFEYLPGAIDALKMLSKEDFGIVIITNQSGVARGLITEEQVKKLNAWLLEDLRRKDINIQGIYYCPHHPDASVLAYKRVCSCRKPRTLLFQMATLDMLNNFEKVNFKDSVVVGDKLSDLSFGDEIGCKKYLIGEFVGEKDIKSVSSLLECVRDLIDIQT